MEQDMSLNRRLKRLLAERGMSVSELAVRSGLRYPCLSRALGEKRPLYADELPPLARALGLSVDELLFMEE